MSAEVHSMWGTPGLRDPAFRPGSSASPPLTRSARDVEMEQLKGQFLASLSHEIRTPLSGLMGMADLLGETTLDGEQSEYLGGIRECAQQLLETLNSVLDYSAISAGQLRCEESEFHLVQVLESVAAETLAKAEAKGLKMTLSVEDGLPETATGDARLLRQALTHLLRNAVKFTARGEVELHAGYQTLPGRKIALLVAVRDTGIGIPGETLNALFESFRQLEGGLARRHAGLGLGLALVDRLMRLMQGGIEVSSEPGVGSTFTLRVPLRVHAAAARKPEMKAAVAGRRRILVVDDNKIAQHVVEHILGRAGFEIECADSGEAALIKASAAPYDLVLMDLQMPGMDGLAAARQLRQLGGYSGVPILALTANYCDDYRGLCEQAGMQGFLRKPFDKEELVRTVQTLTV